MIKLLLEQRQQLRELTQQNAALKEGKEELCLLRPLYKKGSDISSLLSLFSLSRPRASTVAPHGLLPASRRSRLDTMRRKVVSVSFRVSRLHFCREFYSLTRN